MFDGIEIDPVAFTLPFGDGFEVYWYGIIITLGIALGSVWGAREIERRGQSVDEFLNGLLIAVLSGYLFARLTYVVLDVLGGNGGAYRGFIDVINIRSGGVNILGGFIGAAIVTWLYVRTRKLKAWQYADVVGPTLLLAQGIGRWGNFINHELYGPPMETDRFWGIQIPLDKRLSIHRSGDLLFDQLFHPTFLYESIWLILGFVVLLLLNRKYRGTWLPGTLFGVFMVWWGFGRFFIEFFRPDQVTLSPDGIVTYSMLMSIGIVIAGLLLLLNRFGKLGNNKKNKRPTKPKPRRATTQ